MAKRLKRTKDGTVDLRTKKGKEIAARLAKARKAKEKKAKANKIFKWLR